MSHAPDHDERLRRARLALDGLSVGDAFGERFFGPPEDVLPRIASRTLPTAGPWRWTDDTAMAASIVEVLATHGEVDEEALARRFGRRYREDPARGYGGTAHGILQQLALGAPWRLVSSAVFDGQGSRGNGGGMRAAPVGAYFADSLERVVAEARRSAVVTHAHPDGQAGAIAVAVAAALACQHRASPRAPEAFLLEVCRWTPAGPTCEGLERAAQLADVSPEEAALRLGSGQRVISSDTVPFALWCAAGGLSSFEDALWRTVAGLGDRDTTCAMVGGVVALACGAVPAEFLEAREPLPVAS